MQLVAADHGTMNGTLYLVHIFLTIHTCVLLRTAAAPILLTLAFLPA